MTETFGAAPLDGDVFDGRMAHTGLNLLAEADIDSGFEAGPVTFRLEVPGVIGLPASAVEWAYAHWAENLSGVRTGRTDRQLSVSSIGTVDDFVLEVTTSEIDSAWISAAAVLLPQLALGHLGHRSTRVAVGDPAQVEAEIIASAQAPEVFEREYWPDFTEALEDLEPATVRTLPTSEAGVAQVARTALPVPAHIGQNLTTRSVVVGAVVRAMASAGALTHNTTDGLLIDVDESARSGERAMIPGQIARRFPVLVPGDVLAGTPDPAGADERWFGALVDAIEIDGETATDHGALKFMNPLAEGMFDDLPEADILVLYRHGDALPVVGDNLPVAPEFGRYALVVSVWVGQQITDGQHEIVVDVSRRGDADVSAQRLVNLIAAGISASGVGRPTPDIIDAAAALQGTEPALVPVDEATRTRVNSLFGTVRDILPVSPLQEGLLFHLLSAENEESTDLYASQFHLTVDGVVDAIRMREAVRALLRRYPNLSAGFATIGDRSLSVIPAITQVPFAQLSLHDWSARFASLAEVFEHERAQPFSATSPPLIRFLLIETSATSSILCVTFEHLLADGWSAGLMMDTLLDLYTDPSGSGLDDVVSFRRYLQWLGERDLDAAREIWLRQLSGVDEPTLLHPGAAGVAASTSMARDHHEDLDAQLSAQIREAAATAGVTVSTFLQTAWAITLGRLVGRDDVVFGTTVSGRPAELEGAESIVGLLFNTVPVRLQLRPQDSVATTLLRLHSGNMDVLDHPYVGLSAIQSSLGMRTLFDTLFIIQNHPGRRDGERYGPDGELRVTDAALTDSTHYPVSFALYPGERIHVRCAYRGDVLTAEEVSVLVARLRRVLTEMSTDIGTPVGRLAVATTAEIQQVNVDWNATTRQVDPVTVADLFEEQAALSSGHTALVAGPIRMTFAELHTRVNQMARMFLASGVRTESRVILMLPRDERMIVAMFATFAVGAAYVPVDGDYPADRVGFMIDAAAPTLILTAGALAAKVGQHDRHIVDLNDTSIVEDIESRSGEPISDAERGGPIRLDNLAYIIFTSGSTGRPKGVAVPYRGLTNMYFNHAEKIFDRVVASQGGRRMRIAHTTSFSFDASWEQLFWMLAGHEVHVIDEDLRREPAALLAHYDREAIDGFDVTPSYGLHLIEQGLLTRDRPRGLSMSATSTGVVFVSLGGEAVPDVLWTALREAPGVEGYNLYGPTEYTINALGADVADSPVSSVGNPIFNTRAYILDAGLGPVLPGVPGELYLAGAGVARGYQDQQAMTSHRFVACPWGDGERMYRTGDLARWRDDGSIDFLGRADDQVKIRGFRVELGEIVNVLLDSDMVSSAAVVVRDGAAGPALIAYVVPAGDASELDVDVLRDQVSDRLPDYMIPAAFGIVEDIPLTINGKVDTRALPEVETDDEHYEAPRTPTEEAVAEVMAEILGVDRVSVSADFFRLGGHSLLAMRVVARVNGVLGCSLSLRDVFDRPSVAGIAGVVDGASGGVVGARVRVSDVVCGSVVPASFGQQALWLIGQVTGPGAVYTIPVVLRCSADFDASAWQAALFDVVARQQALRTLLVDTGDGELVQRVIAADDVTSRLSLDAVDLRDDSSTTLSEQVQDWVRVPVDLAVDFPVRAAVFSGTSGAVVAALAIHHAFMDEWSLPVLLRDLGTAYTARRDGLAPVWEPLAASYGQYATWQRTLLGDADVAGSVAAQQLDYWKTHLAGAPEVSMVSTDRPRPAVASFDGFTVEFTLDQDVTQGLRELCATSDVSMYMVVQAAVAVMMNAFGAGDDVVLGSPVGGRGDADLDDLVGYFVNTLPLRHRLDSNPSLAQVLDQAREVVLGGFAHQDVPFDQIAAYSGAARSSAHNPLFQTLVTYRVSGVVGSSADSLSSAGFAPYTDRVDVGSVKCDLEIDLGDSGDGLFGEISCASSLFDRSTADRLALGLRQVLAAFAGDIGRRLSDVSVLDEGQTRALDGWSRGDAVDIGEEQTLDVLFADAVRAHADRIALRGAGIEMTYREFGTAVAAVAERLRGQQLRTESRVAVLMPRSAEMVTGFVGAIEAGATVVPIDPAYPAERIEYILHDSRPVVVLTTSALVSSVAGAANAIEAEVVTLDSLDALTSPDVQPATVVRSVAPANAAYVIYTSGTTGRPKGVVVSHASIVNLIWWRQSVFTLDEGDAVLHKTSVGFDPAVPEILWPLVTGGTVHVTDDGGDRDLEYLGAEMAAGTGAFVELVPSVIGAMLEQDIDIRNSGIKYLSAGGEALTQSLYERVRQSWGVPVWNTYGPAEAAVEVTSFRAEPVTPDDTDGPGDHAVPIGRPVWNTEVRVLDQLLRPVGVGVVGELYIGGVQLARGYLDRPALTAGRFVADPGGGPGARLYRTGDLVRWNAHGQLVFIGRTDSQVKVNGSRVELGEVEALLCSIPGISAAAVTAPGGSRLAAHVTPSAGTSVTSLDPAEIRSAMFGKAPAHMVPAHVTVLPALPRTANGKLDYAALEVSADDDATGRRATTRTEQAIAAVFADVLGIDDPTEVSIDDDFFRLGGHSLLAMRVVARVNGVLGCSLSLRDVFDRPSVAGIAGVVDGASGGVVGARVRVSDVVCGSVVPASFGQQALWLIGQVTGPGAVYTIPVVLTCSADFDTSAWQAALFDVVARQQALRTLLVHTDEGVLAQQVVPLDEVTSWLHVDEFDVAGLSGAAVSARVTSWVQEPVDLGVDFPVRAALFSGGPDGAVVGLAVHHAFMDEWSLPVLLRDVGAAYAARCAGAAPEWEPLAVSYSQFAVWQREFLGDPAVAGSVAAEQVDYWLEHLDGAPEVSMVATDRVRPAVASYQGFSVDFFIDASVTEGLRALCDRSGVSMYMVVQAAVAVMMNGFGAGDDVVIGSPIGGRGDADLDNLVGYFVNTLPLRHQMSGNPRLSEVLDQAREVVLAGFAHQDVPFDQIVQRSDITRSGAHNPVFQTLVTYRVDGVVRSSADTLAGLGFAPFGERVGIGAVKCDLEIDLGEGDDDLVGVLSCATSLFDEATAHRLAGGLQRVLAAFAGDADLRLSDVSVLDDEQIRTLHTWSHGEEVEPPAAESVDVLLTEAARSHADSVAVRGGGVSLTYRVFDADVNRLARLLRNHGVETGDRVAVMLPRSVNLPSVLAGVMRAGAAYVPIDASNPADRIEYVLSHSGSSVVVVDETTRAALDDIDLADAVVVIDLGTDPVSTALAELSTDPVHASELSRRVVESDAAYVIYTSGTTGRPKGVVVEHRGLLNFLIWKQRATGIESDDSVLQKTPISFDASVWEFFVPLMIGATVVMAEPDGHRDPAYLAKVIAEEQLTTIEFVPSMLDALLEHGIGDTDTSSLRRIFCGGEAFSVATASAAVATFGDILYNLYGPTETTVGITSQQVGAPLLTSRDRFGAGLPIGVPAHNAQAWVLDHRLRLAPVGVVGELYLGGPQLARGYLGRPDLTAGSFVANKFGDGERLYRTGDVVRWNNDGALEYLGRVDDQIKIRGFRVEVDEIRTVLEEHPAVRSAAVAARERDHEKYLVAYYCLHSSAVDGAGIERSLRDFLTSRLPEYMVPSAFCVLDAIPVTPNGKLDTKALPEPTRATSDGGTEPSGPVEVTVAAVVREVLGLEDSAQIMVEDNFFRLGGHSLLAARLVSRLNAELGSSLTMQSVFAGPTVGTLAAACGKQTVARTGDDALLLELQANTEAASVFCVHASSGFGTVYGPLGGYIGARGLIALQDPAHAQDPRDFATIDEVVIAYTQAIRAAQPQGPYDLLGWSYGGHIAFGIARELQGLGEDVATLTILDTPPVTPETIVRWEDPVELEAEVIRSFAMFAQLPDVAGLSREQLQARNRASGGPLSNLGDAEAFAFMQSFERCLRLMEAQPTHGTIDTRVLLVLGREHADCAGETAELWQRHVVDPLDVLVIDVDHEELVSTEGVATWAPWWSGRLTQ